MEYRPTRDCERRAGLYADLADESRAAGQVAEADDFLLLAWAAYDDVDGKLAGEDIDREAGPLRQRA